MQRSAICDIPRRAYTRRVKRIPPWLSYSVLRLALFALLMLGLHAVGVDWISAVLLGSVLAFVISMLLLRRPREATAIALATSNERRSQHRRPRADELIEDAQLDDPAGEHADVSDAAAADAADAAPKLGDGESDADEQPVGQG